jgi:hypothetical protein
MYMMAARSKIVALLPLVAWGYRDSWQAYSSLEVSAASAAQAIVVHREPAAIFLLVAFGALLFCLLACEGSPPPKRQASGQPETQEGSAEGQQADGSGAGGEPSCLSLVSCYCVMFLAVLVPDLAAVYVYSPEGLGPEIYHGIANDRSNTLGDRMALVSVCWLTVMFVLDMFDSQTWGYGLKSVVRFLSFWILVVLVFFGFTLKLVKYPWVPILMLMLATVCLLAFKRIQWSEATVGLPHFYLATATCYTVCATAMLVVWIVWIKSADNPHDLWWNAHTRHWMAQKYAMVYNVLTPDELKSDPLLHGHELKEYCLHKDQIHYIHSSIRNTTTKDLVHGACVKASTVIFTQWAGPFIVFACNMLGVGFCLLFSSTLANISSDSESTAVESKKKAVVTFMQRFLLTVVLAVAIMYTSLYVSGAAGHLGSAMLTLACISLFVMFLWLAWEVDAHTFDELKDDTPIMKNIINIFQSNWVRAILVGGMNVVIPLIMALDSLRQQVRRSCTNQDGTESAGEQSDDQHTPSGSRLLDALEKWDWTDILGKVCVLAEMFVLLAVGSKATFIFFSYLNGAIEAAGLGIGSIFVMVWAIGVVMFMNPIVPGSAVYLFAGVVLGAQSQKEGSVGIWTGLALACIAGSGAKLLACLGQYALGYFMGQSVKVQQFVGVTKVAVLATESVLKEEGFKLFKVCILVAGPDFPTSVLCGILKLNIPQMLLGTVPVIFVSIIPQTLVGLLLTKEGATEGVWSMIATVATGLAAAFQAGATLVFAYGIMQRVEQSGDELLQTHRPEHDEVRKLAEKEAEYVKKYGEMSDWRELGTSARATLLGTVALFLLSCFILALDTIATDKTCFREFYITDNIKDSYDLGGLDGKALNVVIAPNGWIALGLAAAAFVLQVGFGQWLAATTRGALIESENKQASDTVGSEASDKAAS